MKRAIVVLLLLIANAVFGSSTTTAPDTAPGKLLQEWLTAFNGADGDALRKFAETRYTTEARQGRSAADIAEAQLENRQANGGWDFFKVEQSTPTELTVLLKSRATFPRFGRFTFKVAAPDASVLVDRKGALAELPEEERSARKPADELAQELDAKLDELARKDQFSGAALIAQNGKPVWQKAYGMQDREKKIPVDLETRFRLGSMNKMFTAVAIGQLVDAGKLKFSDTIATVWPDYPNKEIAGKATIHHLLTHTSGLGDIFGPAFFKRKDSLREISDYVALFADKPLQFEPGARWSYSNAGFIVLGVIIEKLSGENYYDYVQRHIYKPAAMTASGSTPKTERPENLAVGYMHDPAGKLVPNGDTLPWRGMSAGGGESNVGDLLRFANALREHKLLSPETTELIISGKVETHPGAASKYAYGFSDREGNGRRIVGHNGGAPGMNADLSISWNDGYTVAVLSNRDPTVAQDAAEYVADRLL